MKDIAKETGMCVAQLVEQQMTSEKELVKAVYSMLPYKGSDDEQKACFSLLYRHSRDVANLALAIARRHPEMEIDTCFVEEAALLHDVGVVCTDAPGIHCHGTEPYIRHGELGAMILESKGLRSHANVARRHTGAGISLVEIEQQDLPLSGSCMPESIEEKLICYADKFFSKSHPEKCKTMEGARRSLTRFGCGTMERFEALVELFGEI